LSLPSDSCFLDLSGFDDFDVFSSCGLLGVDLVWFPVEFSFADCSFSDFSLPVCLGGVCFLVELAFDSTLGSSFTLEGSSFFFWK